MRTVLIIIAIVCVLSLEDVYGSSAEEKSLLCNVEINSVQNLAPISYGGKDRINPDGSAYPGDAVHFIFQFLGSDTCTSFTVSPLVNSHNFNITSALVIFEQASNPKPHNVIEYLWVPKYLETYHYYTILDVQSIHHSSRGGANNWVETILTLSENPVLSLREDAEPTSWQLRKINKYESGHLRDDIHVITTTSWHLVKEKTSYNIEVDTHSLEDKNSEKGFIDTVKSVCSNLLKNNGCIFGHAEINSDIDPEREICLFTELDKMGIQYDKLQETDDCVSISIENVISASVIGTGISCDNDECTTYTKTDSASLVMRILRSFGAILFEYPQIYDPDGFPAKNNDGTYYLDNPIGIFGAPDTPFREERSGIISFDGEIISNPLNMIDFTSCDSMCNATLTGEKMSTLDRIIENGDMLSTHYTPDLLGISDVKHVSKMYNIERYVGEFAGTATPLVVIYDPQITDVKTWSKLSDGGLLSFDNRYGIAIQYAGSRGGGADDEDIIHTGRPVKITDVYSVPVMTNSFGVISPDWHPNGTTSGIDGLGDVTVHESIYPYITADDAFADTFDGAAMVFFNKELQDAFISSAGYARLLRDLDIPQDKIDTYYINVTSSDTLISKDYGGRQTISLSQSQYAFPWGQFSTPLNLTAYSVDVNSTAHIDDGTKINFVDVHDSEKKSEFISAVNFYLNKHDTPEFAFLHMADMYAMNPKIDFDDSSSEIVLLNKTGIYYDLRAYNKAISNNLLSKQLGEFGRDDIMNFSAQTFFVEPSYYDVEISASRNGTSKTNTVSIGGVELSNIVTSNLNLNHDNSLQINKVDDTAIISHDVYFGDITQLLVNGKEYDNAVCYEGCLVFLPDDDAVDISIQNMWGGIATATNVTGLITDTRSPESWIDVAPWRAIYVILALALMYTMYRGIKMIWHSRKNK